MKKRFLPFALALALCLGLMLPTALAASGTPGSSSISTMEGAEEVISISGYISREVIDGVEVYTVRPNEDVITWRGGQGTRYIHGIACEAQVVDGKIVYDESTLEEVTKVDLWEYGYAQFWLDDDSEPGVLYLLILEGIQEDGTTIEFYRCIEKLAPDQSTASSGTGTTVQVTASALNVRSGPGTSYGVTSAVYKGSTQTIVETQNNWGKLSSGGWIYLPYTTGVSSGSTNSTGSSSTVTVSVSALNVRSGPGTSYGVTSVVYKGSAQTIVETQNNWGKLSSGGWIYLPYTTGVSSGSASSSGSSVQVTVSSLYVRSGPGASYGAISAVHQGDVLTIVETKTYSGGYSWGKLSSGGWIYLAYTKAV